MTKTIRSLVIKRDLWESPSKCRSIRKALLFKSDGSYLVPGTLTLSRSLFELHLFGRFDHEVKNSLPAIAVSFINNSRRPSPLQLCSSESLVKKAASGLEGEVWGI